MDSAKPRLTRRNWMVSAASASASAAVGGMASVASAADKARAQTVLGPIDAEKLGVTLMHEHAPIVDWSELFETRPAPLNGIREKLIADSVRQLDAFQASLKEGQGQGAIVEATPIRVGRYPRLLVELARRTKVHVIASTGFWCEALAPQHPWAVRLSIEKGGVRRMADLFVREITRGMEDPLGKWGQKHTDIRAGIIKIGTSSYLRPSERAIHQAAAWASKETGCPITTHTTQGGGLEQAQFLLKHGASPQRVIIGHQGFKDDRETEEAHAYHRLIARLGCYVQFDRVGHKEYGVAKQARQIVRLIREGFVKQLLVSHDHAPYYYPEFSQPKKRTSAWKALNPDYTIITRQLVPELKKQGATEPDLRTMLIENPRRVLAFVKA